MYTPSHPPIPPHTPPHPSHPHTPLTHTQMDTDLLLVISPWTHLFIILFLVSDPDNDFIKCRFAQGFSECGSICNGLPGAYMDEVSICHGIHCKCNLYIKNLQPYCNIQFSYILYVYIYTKFDVFLSIKLNVLYLIQNFA